MKYAVNEAGVSSLHNISATLVGASAGVFEKTSQLQILTADNEDSLGPHKASLNQAIMEIYIGLKESAESISVLAATAKDVAEAYQEIIDNDYLSTTTYEIDLLDNRLLDFDDSSMPARILDIQEGLVATSGLAENIQHLQRKMQYILDRERLDSELRQKHLSQSSEIHAGADST